MANDVPPTVFLAETTPQLVTVLTCLAGLGIRDAAVFVERNTSFGWAALDALLGCARERFPTVRFIELEIQRPGAAELPTKKSWTSFFKRWRAARSMFQQLDAACRASFGLGLKAFGAQVEEVYFTAAQDYVIAFLAACREKARVLYPHGFDHPRRQTVREYAYLCRRRSWRTVVQTFPRQMKFFGPGGLLLGIIGHVLPGMKMVRLPFTGVDRVVTFRSDVDYVPNEVVKVPGLADTFRWLLRSEPWSGLLAERQGAAQGSSLLLLLPELNVARIWEKNRNYGLAHLHLLRAVSLATAAKRMVIKAHVRSDGSAAKWLAAFLQEREEAWHIEILPQALSGLPVEALILTGEFAAACSLGSCSLPPGLGFGVPHYVSLSASALFDEGWFDPYWLKYVEGDRMLIAEGICCDVDPQTTVSAAGVESAVPVEKGLGEQA